MVAFPSVITALFVLIIIMAVRPTPVVLARPPSGESDPTPVFIIILVIIIIIIIVFAMITLGPY